MAPIILAAGAAAAGYYFYGSKQAKQHRQQAAKWAGEFKQEVMKGVNRLPKVDEKAVKALIGSAADSFKHMRSVRKEDVAKAAQELRKNWQRLVSESRAGAGKKSRATKRAAPKKARSRTR